MRNMPGRTSLPGRQWVSMLLLCALLLTWGTGIPAALAQGLTDHYIDEVEYIEPRLPSDVATYDPERPEDLLPEQLYAKSAILIEASSGDVIFEKNADQVMYPASTTKILTTLLGLMMGDMSQEVTLSEEAGNLPEGSSTISLRVGESIGFENLLYATMIRSGNEGANLIAETISGTSNDFVALMNQTAAMFGCTSTNFMNASGLHHPDHYSTVQDMAKIARAAMENETFRDIVKTYTYSLPRSNMRSARALMNPADHFLNPNRENNSNYYPYAIGVKTGYHSHAGYCYVGAAEKDGVELISVVFYSSIYGRWTDTKKLMEYGFSQFVSETPMELYNRNPITLETSGFSREDTELGRLRLDIRPREGTRGVNIVGTRTEMDAIARNLKQTVLIDYTREFNAPITAGETIGTLTYYPTDGGSAVVYDLVASRSIERRENAPKTIEQIEAEVYADPNPFPPFSFELLVMLLAPFIGVFIALNLLMRIFRRAGPRKGGRIPKPESRHYQ